MSQTKQHGNKSEFNKDQALKKTGNQQIKRAAFDLPSVVQRVSNNSARRSRDILTLQQTLGNRTVQRLLAEDSRLESEVAKGEAGTEIVQRQSFNQAGATVNGGDGTPLAGGGGTVNMLEVESHAAVQRQSYFDLYERSRKLDELKQRKKHLHTEREKVSKALEKAKKVLEGLQMEAGEKEKPTGVRIIETIGEFF